MAWFNLGNNGAQVRFWEDVCLGNVAFREINIPVFIILLKKSASVSVVLRSNPLNVSFRRSLVGNNLLAWYHLVARVMNVQLTDQRYVFKWSLHQHDLFNLQYILCIER